MIDAARLATADDYTRRILAVLVHIQSHLDDDLDLESLAAVARFSPFHFHRVFRGLVGEGVREHVRRLRLERAAQRLKVGDDQVVRIALDAGYQTHESFTRAFTAMFGAPPREFRAQRRALMYPPAPSNVHYSPQSDGIALIPQGDTTVEIQVERLPPRRVAFVRHIGPYMNAGVAWNRLLGWAGPRGLLGPRMEYFGLCYDDPDVTPPDKVRYDACLVVGPDVRPEGDIGVQDVPGGEFAAAVHEGPYDTLGRTYAALCGHWLAASGRTLGDPPSVEMYLNDPRTTPPEQRLTKVCMRLA